MAMRREGDFKIFTLYIEGVNINNVGLEDIGQYLYDLAEMLGRDAEPRYHKIKGGSLSISAKVPHEREIDVKTRGFSLRTGDAPEAAVRAEQRISKRLGMNRARKATLLDQSNTKVIEIPIERSVYEPSEVPPLRRSGSLQGKIIRIGGIKEVVSVELQDVDGHIYLCKASREKAKELAHTMFDRTIRVQGNGLWRRGEEGIWYVEDFQIADSQVLDDDTLGEIIEQVRQIPSAWIENENSFDDLMKMRRGEDVEP